MDHFGSIFHAVHCRVVTTHAGEASLSAINFDNYYMDIFETYVNTFFFLFYNCKKKLFLATTEIVILGLTVYYIILKSLLFMFEFMKNG